MPRNIFHIECKANRAGNRGELMIYSSISPYTWDRENPSVTSRNFDRELKDLEDADEITIRINSPGGAVNEAVAIRTMLMKNKAEKIIDIEGSCCSAATIIACLPGARVRMAKGGDYMIHRSSWIAIGHADAMLSAYNSLTSTDNDLADIYAERTGKSKEECMEMMEAETWMSADKALEEGFIDEIISAAEDEEPIAACALSAEVYETMKSCYVHTPEHEIAANENVSNEEKAVAAGNSSENTGETPTQGGTETMENTGATAEMVQQENSGATPEITGETREQILKAERQRCKDIRTLAPKGAKWEKMAQEAINNGDSPETFLRAIIAEQDRTGEEYLENRRAETRPADKIGAGDAGDLDGQNSKEAEDQLAKELARLANGMDINVTDMA